MNSLNPAQAAPVVDPRPALQLELRHGVTVAVPPALSSITTYVLLEQEAWFEKEIDFLLRYLEPGMTAIDIGANLGVYSLPMARLVGPSGCVFAYEPGGEARALLEQSRHANGFGNLDVLGHRRWGAAARTAPAVRARARSSQRGDLAWRARSRNGAVTVPAARNRSDAGSVDRESR